MRRNNTLRRYNFKKAFLLLLLLAVFLIMSTYAWFTSNKLVKVSSLNINVQATEGFQISVDGLNWKAVISATDILGAALTYSASKNHLPTDMFPHSTATTRDTTAGFMNMFLGLVEMDDDGEYLLTAEQVTEATSTGGFIAFDLFFKTNNDIELFLDETANVTDIGVGTRANKGMENAARIAFVEQGNVPATEVNPSLGSIQGLSILTDGIGDKVTMWEPNYDKHTAAAVIEAYNIYNKTISETMSSRIDYDGVNDEMEIADEILLSEADATNNPTLFKVIPTSRLVTTKKDRTGTVRDTTNIILKAGITKMRIYMWLEGQDVDCGDSASGSDVRFDLVLTAEKVTTP